MMPGIEVSLALSDIDPMAMGLRRKAKPEELSRFMSDELSKAGGKATVAVDGEMAEIQWVLPDTGEEPDPIQVAYVAHLLQVGLLADPIDRIAKVAYAGGITALALNLLAINSSGRNKHVAERDARLLAKVAPFSPDALAMLGMILLENGKVAEASGAFMGALCVERNDFLASKYGAISLTVLDPVKAVGLCERCIGLLTRMGQAPDAHMRATYGMALLSSGARPEAGIQFMLACGSKEPAMGPAEWVGGGYRITSDDIPAALGKKA